MTSEDFDSQKSYRLGGMAIAVAVPFFLSILAYPVYSNRLLSARITSDSRMQPFKDKYNAVGIFQSFSAKRTLVIFHFFLFEDYTIRQIMVHFAEILTTLFPIVIFIKI